MFLFFSLVLIVYVGEFDDSLTIMTTQHWLSEKRLKNILPMAVDKITEALKKSLNSSYIKKWTTNNIPRFPKEKNQW